LAALLARDTAIGNKVSDGKVKAIAGNCSNLLSQQLMSLATVETKREKSRTHKNCEILPPPLIKGLHTSSNREAAQLTITFPSRFSFATL